MNNILRSEDAPVYGAVPQAQEENDRIIAQALEILNDRVQRGTVFDAPKVVGSYFCLRSHDLERELFSIAMLDAQNRLITVRTVATGTLNQAAVYPREVVKQALADNAAAVILHHNHPSGVVTPSRADEKLTKTLSDALALVEIKVLDHVITAGGDWYSFAEHGLV